MLHGMLEEGASLSLARRTTWTSTEPSRSHAPRVGLLSELACCAAMHHRCNKGRDQVVSYLSLLRGVAAI
jgi:hypothetical protein